MGPTVINILSLWAVLASFSHCRKDHEPEVFCLVHRSEGFPFTPLPVALAHLRGLAGLLFIERIRAVLASVGRQLNDDPVPSLLPDSGVPWNEAAFLTSVLCTDERISKYQPV